MNEKISEIIQTINKASLQKNTDYFCTSRDIFQARLDAYIARTQQYLLSAVIGEIGNNTFDHNWDYADGHARGVYFNSGNACCIISDGQIDFLETTISFTGCLAVVKTGDK